MKIGMTYDLRDDYLAEGFAPDQVAEFDQRSTIDAIEGELLLQGHSTDRIGHVRSLAKRLSQGHRWDMVFNIAEGFQGFGRESQVPCLLDAYGIPYVFSDPLVCALTLHKATTKRILRDAGLPTPDFVVVESVADAAEVRLPLPLFAKPVAEGTSKGIDAASKVTSREQLVSVCRRLLERYDQPVLVERFLPGRELTVGVVGTGTRARAVAVMEVTLLGTADQDVYTYDNKELCEERVSYSVIHDALSEEACELSLRAWRLLGCRDGGRVDLRANAEGHLEVLELNPLPGMHPQHSDLPIMCSLVGVSYSELMREIVGSAMSRIDQQTVTARPWGELACAS